MAWDRQITLPFVPHAGMILVFDPREEQYRIDAIIDGVEYYLGKSGNFIVHCRLRWEENLAIAQKAFSILTKLYATWKAEE